jgi:hypothetical protein
MVKKLINCIFLNGEIIAYYKKDEPIFCLNESSIFGEYEWFNK